MTTMGSEREPTIHLLVLSTIFRGSTSWSEESLCLNPEAISQSYYNNCYYNSSVGYIHTAADKILRLLVSLKTQNDKQGLTIKH